MAMVRMRVGMQERMRVLQGFPFSVSVSVPIYRTTSALSIMGAHRRRNGRRV